MPASVATTTSSLTFPPERFSFEEYQRHLVQFAEDFPLDATRTQANLRAVRGLTGEQRAPAGPDVRFIDLMRALHIIQQALLRGDGAPQRRDEADEVRRLMKTCLSSVEGLVAEDGALHAAFVAGKAHQAEWEAQRQSVVSLQLVDAEAGEDALNEAEASTQQAEAAHARRQQELMEKRLTQGAVTQNDYGATLQPSVPVPAHKSATDDKTERLLRMLNGTPAAPPPAAAPRPAVPAPLSTAPTHAAPIPAANIRTAQPATAAPVLSQPQPQPQPQPPQPQPQSQPPQPQQPQPVPRAHPPPPPPPPQPEEGRQHFLLSVPARSYPPWSFPRATQHTRRRGLINLGNTCYMNSVLQCLFSLDTLRNTFISGAIGSLVIDRCRVVNTLKFVFKQLHDVSGGGGIGPVHPQPLKMAIGERNESFRGGQQQDAYEFFLSLVAEAHEGINDPQTHIPAPAAAQDEELPTTTATDTALAVRAFRGYLRSNNPHSALLRCFTFQTRSLTQCFGCQNTSRVFNTEMCLDLPVPDVFEGGNVVSLDACLEAYCRRDVFKASTPTDVNGYDCAHCRCRRNAMRQTTIFSLPDTLVITLKRFKSYGNFADKIAHRVAFPQDLDMSPFCAPRTGLGGGGSAMAELIRQAASPSRIDAAAGAGAGAGHRAPPQLYTLTGIVNHRGNINGGHYTADVYDSEARGWVSISDDVVRAAEKPDRVLAYMLFYRRK